MMQKNLLRWNFRNVVCVFIQGLRNLFACCRVVDVEMRGSERPRGKLKGIKGSHGGFLTIYIDSCKQCRGSWSTLDSAALWLRTHTVKNREKKRLYGRTKIHQLLCDIIFCQIKELNTFKDTLFHIFKWCEVLLEAFVADITIMKK